MRIQCLADRNDDEYWFIDSGEFSFVLVVYYAVLSLMLRCLRSAVCRCCSFASVIHFYEARAKQISIIHCKSLINNSRIDFRNISTLNLLHSPLLVSPEGSIYSLLSLSLSFGRISTLWLLPRNHIFAALRCAAPRDETKRDEIYCTRRQGSYVLFSSLHL